MNDRKNYPDDRSCAGCGHEAAGNVVWFPWWLCRSCRDDAQDEG